MQVLTATGIEHIRFPELNSQFVGRSFIVDVYLPINYHHDATRYYPLLVANDGQDMEEVKLVETLKTLQERGKIVAPICVCIHADKHRKLIYGTADILHYKKLGAEAADYQRFLIMELLPFLRNRYRLLVGPAFQSIAGFSLGGLAAFDTAWKFPNVFGTVGVFSGSFWWRKKAYDNGYTDEDRIMQGIVRESSITTKIKIWLQTGTADEWNDRDHDGIIDSIGDTIDLILELTRKGYNLSEIRYLELEGGEHNQQTWGKAFPDFLLWAYGVSAPKELRNRSRNK